MALITYTAKKGFSKLGSEAIVSVFDKDDIDTGNLLPYPTNSGYWENGANGSISRYNDRTMVLISSSTSLHYAGRSFSTTAGAYYLFRVSVITDGSAQFRITAGVSNGDSSLGASAASSTNRVVRILVKATSSVTYFNIENAAGLSGNTSYVSNVEIKELENLGVDETTQYQTNGTFTTDTSGWTGNNATLAVVSGELEVTLTSTSGAGYQDITGLTAGQVYKLTVTLRTGTGGTVYLQLYDGASFSTLLAQDSNATGTNTTLSVEAAPSGSTLRVGLYFGGSVGQTGYFDNVIVTQSGNLVSNGSFNVDYGWVKGTGWTISGGVAAHAAGSASFIYRSSTSFVAGHYELVTYTISGMTAGSAYITLQWSGGASVSGITRTANGTYTDTLLMPAGSGTVTISFYGSSTFDGSLDDLSIRRAAVDISDNGDGLAVYGEVLKVPVSYGSNVCAYGNWSSENYLQQPYNSNLDPSSGSGDITIACWINIPTAVTTRAVFSRNSISSAQSYEVFINAVHYAYFKVNDGTHSYSTGTSADTDDSSWHHITGRYISATGVIEIFMDGQYRSSITYPSFTTIDNAAALLTIGALASGSEVFTDGLIAGIKIDVGPYWSDQQILNGYNYEKELFQPDSVYAVKGDLVYLECDLAQTDDSPEHVISVAESMDRKVRVETVVAQPIASFANTATYFHKDRFSEFKKFRDEAIGQQFTFDEEGYLYSQYRPRPVVKTTQNEPITRIEGTQYFSMSFNVRDVS